MLLWILSKLDAGRSPSRFLLEKRELLYIYQYIYVLYIHYIYQLLDLISMSWISFSNLIFSSFSSRNKLWPTSRPLCSSFARLYLPVIADIPILSITTTPPPSSPRLSIVILLDVTTTQVVMHKRSPMPHWNLSSPKVPSRKDLMPLRTTVDTIAHQLSLPA